MRYFFIRFPLKLVSQKLLFYSVCARVVGPPELKNKSVGTLFELDCYPPALSFVRDKPRERGVIVDRDILQGSTVKIALPTSS